MKSSVIKILLQKFFTLFIGFGAVFGAVMMWIDPSGESLGISPVLEMLRTKLPCLSIFFKNFIPSSFVLLILIGFTQFAAAFLLFKKHRLASHAVLICGILLMLWIILEWWVIGFNTMSNVFFVLGLLEVLAAMSTLCIGKRNTSQNK